MSVKVWGCNVHDVGGALKKSKKLYTWKFSIDGREQVIELITSFFTGKKKVLLNGTVIYQDKGLIQNKKLQFDFKIGNTNIWLFQKDNSFDMYINNDLFSALWEKEMNRKAYREEENGGEQSYQDHGLGLFQQEMGKDRKIGQFENREQEFDNVWGDMGRKRAQTSQTSQTKGPSKPVDIRMAANAFEKQDCSGVKIVFLDDSHFASRRTASLEKHHNIYSREYRDRPPRVIKEEEEKPKNSPLKQPKQNTQTSNSLFGQFGGWENQPQERIVEQEQPSFNQFFDFGNVPMSTQANKSGVTRLTERVPQQIPEKNPLFESKPVEKKPQANLVDLLDLDDAPSSNATKPDNGFAWVDSSTPSTSSQKQGPQLEAKPKTPVDLTSALGEIFASTPSTTETKGTAATNMTGSTPTTQTNTMQANKTQQQTTQQKKPDDLWNLVDLSDLKGNNQDSAGTNDFSYGTTPQYNMGYNAGFNQGGFQYGGNNQNFNAGNFGGSGMNFQYPQYTNNFGQNAGQKQPFNF